MSEKKKAFVGVFFPTAIGVTLFVNLVHPLSNLLGASKVHIGSGYPLVDTLAIAYCIFILYVSASMPHTIRHVGNEFLFTSLLGERIVAITDIEALERANFGYAIRFRSRLGDFKVYAGAVKYHFIKELLIANPQTKLVEL